MTTDINKRLSQLRQRRTGSSFAMESFSRADSVHAGITLDAAGPEPWETRGTSSQHWTKYALGAMTAVGKKYTDVSIANADRVADQLRDRLHAAGVSTEFKLQGSVPLDVHIRRVSDVDLLTILKNYSTFARSGIKARQGIYRSNTTETSEERLAGLRAQVELDLRAAFPAADVDISGGKAVKVSGASLQRSVDVVPAHWIDTEAYQSSGREEDRGVKIYDKKTGETISNRPFLHIARVGGRCDSIKGGLRKAIRLCKSMKADSDREIKLSSFDIASLMYHADMSALRLGQFTDLAVLAETQRHLDAACKDRDWAGKLLVPDGGRRIFDSQEKWRWLLNLSLEIDDLLSNVYREVVPGQRDPNRLLSEKRNVVKATSI
ncbi:MULTISPECIES: hypothetical protein [Burkholderia cepacia complex]|uniref:Uncharacterized protein n=1 Tax=Burkholderia cenocepacia TaxID=95486 RepID=A0ABD4U4M5_9BURK|nr:MULTISPECIES: hypothetical protein [Burkholderia cepacia complex]MCW3694349.1 hypothetical protein [Burkholderia cenocepacia]MCW3702424.1 hypothetical protein [Burkholderia cenocepacia]MCW3709695.1 hypothetical protein [Burkholderia cenocepacia]MCW3718304.1 hypothetical protein [Burkholderia cenocepacia]MCW3726563.1 hypothetical protein [Burkholderia cenocepacia]